MRFPLSYASPLLGVILTLVPAPGLAQQDSVTRARQLEASGDPQGALRVLREAAESSTPLENNLTAYAEYLDRYGSAGAAAAYEKLLPHISDQTKKRAVLRRLVVLNLEAGNREAATKRLSEYRSAGGTDLGDIPTERAPEGMPTVAIPGPYVGFARMAALSPSLKPLDVLPALARNVVTNGYQAASSQEGQVQTEYLKLLLRYLNQAREIEILSGEQRVIRIETCESTQTGELLRILGYRMRGGCGGEVVLETVNASRAFLTIDSGFPLAELEQALRTSRPFEYDYHPTLIPVLYGPEYWLSSREKQTGEFLSVFLDDPALCRLYLGLAKLDPETADSLRKAMPAPRLRAFANVLDFFGGMFLIRDGKAPVPGAPRSTQAWAELAGASPDSGPQFIEKLLLKDDGWLTSHFDALSRLDGPALEYLTEPNRLKRFYNAMRGQVTSPGPARPVFRANADLMLLTTRLRIEPDGKPHIPGGIEVWKNLFEKPPNGKYDDKLTKAARGWSDPDDIIEALFALCRKQTENEPLKIFMALSDVNRHRATPLQPATVDRLARDFRGMSAQYPIFAEVPTLSDEAIIRFLDVADHVGSIRDQSRRADAAGTMQALIGLWQIFSRNGSIKPENATQAFTGILDTFAEVDRSEDIFRAGIASSKLLLAAAGVSPNESAQERMLDLLAGTTRPGDQEAHRRLVQDMLRILDVQRLVSLKTLIDMAAQLDAMEKGEAPNMAVVNRLTEPLEELQLPRASLSTAERTALSFGYWTERHIDTQRKLKLRAELDRARADAGRVDGIRADLAGILRDTLVGFNYIYYAPPGAQLLRTNPLFVRSHDFLGVQGTRQTWRTTEVLASGWPSSAGGRLVGSLAGLAYALADAEQNFLIPTQEQALIWGDLVPQMILSAKIPRWWQVTRQQMHWAGLHLRLGESLVAESILDPKLRDRVISVLSRQAAPSRVSRVAGLLASGDVSNALDNITSSELFQIAGDYSGSADATPNLLSSEIRRMAQEHPETISYEKISRAFGTPKPTLTTSYRPELLNLRTFPTLMGYSSRIMAESWESNILYYAALADELHLSPGQLNVAIPQWTQRTVEEIFATHLEDWPALLRSLRFVGEDIRNKTQAGDLAGGIAGQ